MIRRTIATCLLATLTLSALVVPATAGDDDTLKAGKNAPELKPKKVMQGDLPTLNASEGCVVVEFWATWCAPCQRSIPHLNKLYNELKPRGLQVIGISDEEEKTVSDFLKKKGTAMGYPVAADKDGDTGRNWMRAAKQDGIPCAFIVARGGRVLWIGNPLDEQFEPNVRKALTGRFDPPLRAQMDPMVKAAQKCADVRNFAEAYKHYDEALDVDSGVGLDVAQERFKTTLLKEGNVQGAYNWLVEVAKKRYGSDTGALNEFVSMVLKDPEVKPRSMETADRLLEVLGSKGGPKGLATQAMVAAAKGDTARAIELQTDAWMGASPEDKAAIKRVLDEYRATAANRPAASAADAKRGG
jgi:peroxiredoxin